MKDNKVIQFEKDHKFYFKKGSETLLSGDYLTSIKYFQKAIELIKNSHNFLKSNYCLNLAQAYAKIDCFELSNFYYFSSLDFDVYSQVAFKGLGENFAHIGDPFLTRYYLNQCINLLDVSYAAKDAKKQLLILDRKINCKFKDVKKIDSSINLEKDIKQAEFFMSKGRFEEAIKIFEKIGDFKNPKIRAELSLCYFFINDTKNGVELIEKFGDESALDLCNLLLIYFCEGNTKKFLEYKKKLKNYKIETVEEYFKIGLTFAQTDELELAKSYMKNFLEECPNEHELSFLYCLTCINSKEFETAKKILIDLKAINPFKKYLFDFYLDVCEKKLKSKFEYVFSVPVSHYLKIQNQIKSFLVMNDAKFKKAFLNNMDLFYFVLSLPDSNTKNMVLIKLSKLNDEEISQYFRYVLLANDVKGNLKSRLVINRIESLTTEKLSFVKDGFFVKIILPNLRLVKRNNPKVFEALVLCLEFLLNETQPMNIFLKRNIFKIERVLELNESNKNFNQAEENKYIIASYLTWDFLKEKSVTLNKICKYFNVNQEDFYKFIEKYNLEV